MATNSPRNTAGMGSQPSTVGTHSKRTGYKLIRVHLKDGAATGEHEGLHEQLCRGRMSAGLCLGAQIDNRTSAAYRTFTQTLFSWVSSRMTEKPISRP